MNSKTRVSKALRKLEGNPDRVPVQFIFAVSSLMLLVKKAESAT